MGVKWLRRKKCRVGTLLNFINEKKLRLWSLCGFYFSTYSISIIFTPFWKPILVDFGYFLFELGAISRYEWFWRFSKLLKGFIKAFGVVNENSRKNKPYESHVTLFRWPFLSNKALAVTWVQPKTSTDSFMRSIRVQTWIENYVIKIKI